MATFAPISIEALESLRKTGMTDDAIAEQMAQSSPGFSSQLSKIRKKFAGDPAATTAYLNTRFYGVVDHAPDKPKGIVGRSLDRVYDNFQKDTQDIRTALEQNAQGQQGFVETVGEVAGNLSSIVASPVALPAQEAVGSLAKAAYENVPGVKPLLQEVGQSRLVQEGIVPAIQTASQVSSNLYEKSPSFRALAALGEGASDLADVYGAAQAGKFALNSGIQAAKAIPQIPRLAGQAIGTTARIGTQPIREGFGGFMQGVRGQVDDAAKAAAPMELSGVAKEAVSKGLDENVVRFAVEQAPETKKAMAAMVKAAKEGSTKLGGDTAHKEILGQYILNNTEHLLNEKKAIGDALGAMKKGMADDVLDLTDDLVDLQTELRNAGAAINEKGIITRLAADSDDNIPMLQEALNFLQPDDAGRVVRRFKDVDMWRSKMFKEMNSAKAKMQPSASGQSVFGFAEKVVNNLRRSAIKRASKNNSRLLAYNDAYEELSTQTSKFLKSIGYKGKLDIDSITAKELRTGEIALRTLGNASAETRDVLRELTAMARKYGYTSKVDEMNLVRWADTIENLFPVTPTRSLQGGVSRGTKDALGNFTEDVIRSGARRGVIGAVSEKVMEGIDTFRGMTPENQYRLLLELLDDAPSAKSVDNIPLSTLSPQVVDEAAKVSGTSKQLSKKFPNLTPEEIAQLTPEEKATGILGGSDTATSSVTQAQKSVNGGSIPDIETPKNNTGPTKIYHATDKVFDEFDPDKSQGGGIWFTDRKDLAETGQVGASGKGIVMERSIDESKLKLGGWDEYDKFSTQELIDQGYDGLKLVDGDRTTYAIYDPKKLSKSSASQNPIPSKATGIPKELEPLAKEARKYKSAEEFVKAQGEPLYHGTNATFETFDPKKIGSATDDGLYGKGFYFGNTENFARIAPRGRLAKNVMEVYPKSRNFFDIAQVKTVDEMAESLDMSPDSFVRETNGIIRPLPQAVPSFTSKVKGLGYDGVVVKRGGDAIETVVFDPNNLQTKSQLTDLWKQANQSTK